MFVGQGQSSLSRDEKKFAFYGKVKMKFAISSVAKFWVGMAVHV